MKTVLRWLGRAVMLLLLLVGVVVAAAWWISDRDMARVYAISDPPLPAVAAADVATRGAHLYATRGCADCHGADGSGTLIMDAGPLARISAPNITPTGLAGRYDLDAIGRAIRHGVREDSTPLVFMPSDDYSELSDADTALIAAYVLSLPAREGQPEPTEVRPLGRVLHLFGQFPLLPATRIEHAARTRAAPEPAATAQYGFYLAQICTGCHGLDFGGLKIGPPSAPRTADLRPGRAMAGWSEQDFVRAMREGLRPDGSTIDPFMPWQSFGGMTDVELSALWQYFQTLPPVR